MNELMLKLQEVNLGRIRALCLHSDGSLKMYENYEDYTNRSFYVLPTAANPLHKGHLHMANFVQTVRDAVIGELLDCEFELSMTNVDKGDISINQVHDRLLKFMHLGRTCWVTKFATFVQKSYFFYHTQFIIGSDTANRIIDSKYYHDCDGEKDRTLSVIHNNACTFMVLNRLGHKLCSDYFDNSHMFFIEEYDGCDISSTKIREKEVMRPPLYTKELNVPTSAEMSFYNFYGVKSSLGERK